jgi:hypothetical protein
MFSNPFYDTEKPGKDQESLSNKNILDDMTEQSIDVSNIEEPEANHKAVFSNPFDKKGSDSVNIPDLSLISRIMLREADLISKRRKM